MKKAICHAALAVLVSFAANTASAKSHSSHVRVKETGSPTYETPRSRHTRARHNAIESFFRVSASVSFDANGGQGTMKDQRGTVGSSIELKPNKFTRPNHKFLGWALTPNGSIEYEDGDEIRPGQSHLTLYAIWRPLVKITYKTEHGTTEPESVVPLGSPLELPRVLTPSYFQINSNYLNYPHNYRTCTHRLIGWALTPDGEAVYNDEDEVEMTGDLTLYAVWKRRPPEFTVKDGVLERLELNGNKKITIPAEVVKVGDSIGYDVGRCDDLTVVFGAGTDKEETKTIDGRNFAKEFAAWRFRAWRDDKAFRYPADAVCSAHPALYKDLCAGAGKEWCKDYLKDMSIANTNVTLIDAHLWDGNYGREIAAKFGDTKVVLLFDRSLNILVGVECTFGSAVSIKALEAKYANLCGASFRRLVKEGEIERVYDAKSDTVASKLGGDEFITEYISGNMRKAMGSGDMMYLHFARKNAVRIGNGDVEASFIQWGKECGAAEVYTDTFDMLLNRGMHRLLGTWKDNPADLVVDADGNVVSYRENVMRLRGKEGMEAHAREIAAGFGAAQTHVKSIVIRSPKLDAALAARARKAEAEAREKAAQEQRKKEASALSF